MKPFGSTGIRFLPFFNRDIKTIGKHINKVFREGELDQISTVAKFATTAEDGKTYQVKYYNFDDIISVGYRVKSMQVTQFRIWTTQRLKVLLNIFKIAA